MIDDEKLQALLGKASSLYNNGEYKGAIEAWREALGVDPGSQKAREGIRMATLLLGDMEAAPQEGSGEAVTLPADGAEPAGAEIPAEEAEARLDLGIARIKQLLSERKYAEAIEGAQGLLPLDPDSPEVLRLLEEAQHAFEAAPFIEEHLTLARELLAQERFSEAEAECKTVFTLDPTHPGAKALLKDIRDKIQESLKAAASQLGGMTVKLTLPQAIAAGVKLKPTGQGAPPAPPAGRSAAAAPKVAAPAPPEDVEGLGPTAGDESPVPESGEGALAQEEVSARAALEAAFQGASLEATRPEDSPFELAGETAGGVGTPTPSATRKDEVVAKTIRPPSSRLVPKGPVPAESPEGIDKTHAPAGMVEPPPVVSGQAKKAPEPPHSSAPAHAGTIRGAEGPHAPGAPHAPATRPAVARTDPPRRPPTPHAPEPPDTGVPVSDVGEDATAAWETELTQLNLKDKERGLLRGTGAKATGAPVQPGDMDLMSLMDSGGLPGMPGSGMEPPGLEPESVPLVKGKETTGTPGRRETTKSHPRGEMPAEAPAVRETPVLATKLRTPDRPRPAAGAPKRGSSLLKVLFFLIVLTGCGGAAWYVYTQPGLLQRLLGGGGQPGQPVAPPAGSPSGTVDGGHGPIPTPIGGTSRQQAASPQPGDGAAVPTPAGGPPPGGSDPGAAVLVPGGNARPAAAGPLVGVTGTQAPKASLPSSEPIKPATVPVLSKEEMQRKIASYTADGRRLIGLRKWREARAKLNAVLALDPANIEVKDLADQAQARIDEEQKLQDEFYSTKQLYTEKDYENALRKLYRLPRDKGLGDIDLYIRNAWYNWAVVLMKAGNSKDALAKLSEELTVDPDDAAALRLQEVAEKYTARAKDRTYYAFTEALALRAFDQR